VFINKYNSNNNNNVLINYQNRSLIRGVGWILSEKKVAWYMNELSTSLWPDGHFIESKPPPTAEETEISRNIAQLMMKDSIPSNFFLLLFSFILKNFIYRYLMLFVSF